MSMLFIDRNHMLRREVSQGTGLNVRNIGRHLCGCTVIKEYLLH